MQFISNILLNFVLLYPIVIIREYCVGESKKTQHNKLSKVAFHLFIVNALIINTAFYLEAFFFFYLLIMVPLGIAVSVFLIKENKIDLSLNIKTYNLGIKSKRLIVLLMGYGMLIVFLSLANNEVNDHVMQIHVNNIEKIRTAEQPIEELIWLSQNPRTLFSDLDEILKINEDDYVVAYSGNSKKNLRGSFEEDNVLYIYDFTYRRIHSKWELDGSYDMTERHYNEQ